MTALILSQSAKWPLLEFPLLQNGTCAAPNIPHDKMAHGGALLQPWGSLGSVAHPVVPMPVLSVGLQAGREGGSLN
jgi:hypothetical protein